jgi:hypothetical protein
MTFAQVAGKPITPTRSPRTERVVAVDMTDTDAYRASRPTLACRTPVRFNAMGRA